MSEALEFGIGGNNDKFISVLKNSEQEAKKSAERVGKNLTDGAEKGTKKLKKDLDGLAGDFGRVTSASGVLDMAIGKIGNSLKAAGAVTAIAAIGKGLYDARQEANEFEKLTRKINQSNTGSAANFGVDELEGRLEFIKAQRKINQDEMSSLGGNLGQRVNAYADNFLNIITGQGTKTADELNSTGDARDLQLSEAQQKAYDRLIEKSKIITQLARERVNGNKEETELMAIQAGYAERIQKATEANQQEVVEELKKQRDIDVSAATARNVIALASRKRSIGEADIAARQAQEAATMTPEAATREKYATDIAMAEYAVGDAVGELKGTTDRAATEAKIEIAKRNVLRLTAEAEKFERDIKRAKEDSLKDTKATGDETIAQIRNQTFLADQIKQKAATEKAVTAALRDGNTELAAQITKNDALLTKQKQIAALTGADGRARPTGQIRAEQRRADLASDRAERVYQNRSANDFIIGAERDLGGNIVGGRDILTGQQVKRGNDGLFYDVKTGDLSKRYSTVKDKDDNSYRVDEYGRYTWTSGPGQSWQEKEMAHQQSQGQQAAKTSADQAAAAAEQRGGANGGESLQTLVKSIETKVANSDRILQSWDR